MLRPDETYDEHERISHTKLNIKKVLATQPEQPHFNPPTQDLGARPLGAQSSKPITVSLRKKHASHGVCDRNADDFFNNIPDFMGETFPPFVFTSQRSDGQSIAEFSGSHSDHVSPTNSSDVLRVCEDLLWRHHIRPDFFCQYHKAISSTVSSPQLPLQTKSKSAKKEESATVDSSITLPVGKNSSAPPRVQRFAKLSAIYTLPVTKRKKACSNLAASAATGKMRYGKMSVSDES